MMRNPSHRAWLRGLRWVHIRSIVLSSLFWYLYLYLRGVSNHHSGLNFFGKEFVMLSSLSGKY